MTTKPPLSADTAVYGTNPKAHELAERPEWCERCNLPVPQSPWWERLFSLGCYWLVLAWPDRFFLSAAHRAILPWAGMVAFSCECSPAERYLRAHAKEQVTLNGGEAKG